MTGPQMRPAWSARRRAAARRRRTSRGRRGTAPRLGRDGPGFRAAPRLRRKPPCTQKADAQHAPRRWGAPSRRGARVLPAAAALLAAVLAAGCQPFAWLLVKTVGPWVPEDTVQAEYDLRGKSVLVLVDAKDPAVASEFPRLSSALAGAIARILTEQKACGPVVPAHSVDAARQAEPDFDKWSVAQAGKFFNVDLVLHVEVLEFRLRDAPASTVYQGYVEGTVRVVSPDSGRQVWPVLANARLVTGETQPDVTADEPGEQESILTQGYAEKIARLFYTHKVADLPMRPKVK